MASTTQPAAKAALVALFTPLFAADGAAFSYGHPGGGLQERHGWVGDTDDESDQEWAALGARARDETYALRLVVVSAVPGSSQQQATEDAFEMFGLMEAGLRANVTLGITGVLVAEIKGPRLDEYVNGDEGFAASVASAARVRARI